MWVRAHLEEDYGLPVGQMHWVTQDPAHVEQYSDPSNVEHVGKGESLPDMLLSGALDAVIMGNDLPKGDDFIPVIPDSAAKDRIWWEKHGFMPIKVEIVSKAKFEQWAGEAKKKFAAADAPAVTLAAQHAR